MTPAQVYHIYLHPRDEKGSLKFDGPEQGVKSSEREQFRRYCFARGVMDERTVEKRYGEWKRSRARHTHPSAGQCAGDGA